MPFTDHGGVTPFSLSRPYFGDRQVRTIKGIKKGLVLDKVEVSGKEPITTRVLVLTDPHEDENDIGNGLRFDYLALSGLMEGRMLSSNPEDCSVLPYDYVGGIKWNKLNYLLRTGIKRLNNKGIAKKLKKYPTGRLRGCKDMR